MSDLFIYWAFVMGIYFLCGFGAGQLSRLFSPGQLYTEASAALREIFTNKEAFCEGLC
jgi:hypothetical protein